MNEEEKKVQLHLIGPDILQGLQVPEVEDPQHHSTKWRPEYASYMIEGEYHTLLIASSED